MKSKNKGGRPPKYKTPKELEKKIDAYFKEYAGVKILKDDQGKPVLTYRGNPVIELKPPTVTGLALKLGFASRYSIYDYAERSDEFSHIIKKAVLRIEEFAESQLYGNKTVGAIFWLKNHKWQDKKDVEAKMTIEDLIMEEE